MIRKQKRTQIWKLFLPILHPLCVICLAILRLPSDGVQFAPRLAFSQIDLSLFLFGQLLVGNKFLHMLYLLIWYNPILPHIAKKSIQQNQPPHVMREFGAAAHKRLAELADVCGMEGHNDAEKANAFIRWIEETNRKMGLPDGFDVIQDQDIDQMITWAKKEANPLYPVPVVWSRKDFRRLIESIRR